jgi:hypothetical protein
MADAIAIEKRLSKALESVGRVEASVSPFLEAVVRCREEEQGGESKESHLARATTFSQAAYLLGSLTFMLARCTVRDELAGASTFGEHHPSRKALSRVRELMSRVKRAASVKEQRRVDAATQAKIDSFRGRKVEMSSDDDSSSSSEDEDKGRSHGSGRDEDKGRSHGSGRDEDRRSASKQRTRRKR